MNLHEIVRLFNLPISEEQAWAILYLSSQDLLKQWNSTYHSLCSFPAPNSIFFEDDGSIKVSNDEESYDVSEILENLAETIFDAMCTGDHTGNTRISQSLSRLFTCMANLEPDEDETDYIEEDCTFQYVLSVCEQRVSSDKNTAECYRSVCRSFLTQARLLLSYKTDLEENLKFLNKNNNNKSTQDVPEEAFTEWTKMWVHVLEGLRSGAEKLRHIEISEKQSKDGYPATPYEILMRDIRNQKFRLREVGDIPQRTSTNPHDILLHFVRGRPSLNPAEQRVLRPLPPRSKSIHENLIEQIQGFSVPLRHVEPPDDSPLIGRIRSKSDVHLSNRHKGFKQQNKTDIPESPTTMKINKRRKLKAPVIRVDSSSEEDSDDDVTLTLDDDDDFLNHRSYQDSPLAFKRASVLSNASSLRSSGTSGFGSGVNDDYENHFAANRRNDVTRTPLRKSKAAVPPRSPTEESSDEKPSFFTRLIRPAKTSVRRAQSLSIRSPTFDQSLLEQKRAEWRMRRQKQTTDENDPPLPLVNKTNELPAVLPEKKKTGTLRRSTSLKPKSPTATYSRVQDTSEYCGVGVTVNDLSHIREVLTLAELDEYLNNKELHINLKKGKICFNCKIRKFSIFSWSSTCQICKQKTCSKCTRPVRASSAQYMNSPVFTLSIGNAKSNASAIPEDGELTASIGTGEPSSWMASRKIICCEACHDLIGRIITTGQLNTTGDLAHDVTVKSSTPSFISQCVMSELSPIHPSTASSRQFFMQTHAK